MTGVLDIEIKDRIPANSGTYYRVLQRLGEGGNSVVYLVLARDGRYRGALFALKIFRRITEAERLDKFLQEITFLRECDHPCIMRIYDDGRYGLRTAGVLTEYPFVVAEYLPETLYDLIRGRTTIVEKLSVTLQLLSALAHLAIQDPPVIHRDIKPQNIFLKGRSCVLGDFGLMKFTDNPEIDRHVFKESPGPGMPRFYRTPDLVAYAKQEADLTPKSDVFQLALVICELFTRWNPCKRAINFLDPVELDLVKEIPGIHGFRIKSMLEQMLIYDPTQRPAAGDLIDLWEGVFREVVTQSHQLEGRIF
jgi:serine/threonine protein kinase